MNKATKLGSRKSSLPAADTPQPKTQTSKKSNPRNPLKELNATASSSSSSSTSVEAPRGCFRFLLSSNPSSKTTLPRSKSLPKTPKSAPNPTQKASNLRPKLPQKNPTKPRSQIPQKPRSSYLLHWQNGKKSSPEGQSSAENDAGKTPQPSFSAVLDENGTPVNKLPSGSRLVSTDGRDLRGLSAIRPPDMTFRSFFNMKGTPVNNMASGSCLVSTPSKTLEEHSSTPPVLASISPKIDNVKPPDPSFRAVLQFSCTPVSKIASGSCLVSTSSKALEEHSSTPPLLASVSPKIDNVKSPGPSFRPVLQFSCTPVSKMASGSCLVSTSSKALEEHSTTPPLLASVSPKIDTVRPSEMSFRPVLHFSGTPINKMISGSCFVSSPGKVLQGQYSKTRPAEMSSKSVLELTATPLNKPATPDKTSEENSITPPVQASISPEIQCGSSLVSTPACFGAGHVVIGVSDRRKCRPRGLLTVGEEVEILGFCEGRASPIPVPAEASVHWHMSPSEAAKKGVIHNGSPELEGLVGPTKSVSDGCGSVRLSTANSPAVASMNWLLSPCEGSKKAVIKNGSLDYEESEGQAAMPTDSELGSDFSSGVMVSMVPSPAEASINMLLSPPDGITKGIVEKGSLEFKGFVEATRLVSESSPSSGYEFCGSSMTTAISPCSQNLKGQATTPASKILVPQEERGYRYDQTTENSPFSGESWVSHNVFCTPVSDSSSGRQAGFSSLKLEDLSDHPFKSSLMEEEVLETVSLSPPGWVGTCDQTDVLPLHGVNFQLSCPATPSNSIDGTRMLKSLYDQKFGTEEFCRWGGGESSSNFENTSQMRISWREGLVSRIFEMDEPDCCQWLSEEEEDEDCGNDRFWSDSGLQYDQNRMNSASTDQSGQSLTNCLRSTEFVCNAPDDKKLEEKCPPPGPISCAESISTDGGGLVASGDSDWTLFYKNQLFKL